MGEVEGSIPSWPLLLRYVNPIAPYRIILNSVTNKTHWWPSGLRRYVQVVVYYVGAGSNPAQCTIFAFTFKQSASVAQLVEHSTVNREVPGSIPGGSVFVIPVTKQPGGLAQSVECVVSNDEAPGSKPGFSTFCRPNTNRERR